MVFPMAEGESLTAPVLVQRKVQDLLQSRIITFIAAQVYINPVCKRRVCILSLPHLQERDQIGWQQ